jgi:hypothetical protein
MSNLPFLSGFVGNRISTPRLQNRLQKIKKSAPKRLIFAV